MAPLRFLVTGLPGVGKTTLCGEVHRRLKDALAQQEGALRLYGFLCHERRVDGRRVAFDMVSLDESRRAPLASVDGPPTGKMVEKYHVQLDDFEGLAFPILDDVLADTSGSPRILIFDEIGKMEMFSNGFVERIRHLLTCPDAGLHILGTVAEQGGDFIVQSKKLQGVEVVTIDATTRDASLDVVAEHFLALLRSSASGGDGTKMEEEDSDAEGPAAPRRWVRGGRTAAALAAVEMDMEPAAVGTASASASSSSRRRRVTFDAPAPGQFSQVYLANPSGNFASMNAGDYLLYVGGAAINRAFCDALKACGHEPKDKYEVLHEALLAKASEESGRLQWLRPGTVFPRPSSGATFATCSYCRSRTECWEASWANWQRRPLCAECWGYYEDWVFNDAVAFCGLVPEGEKMASLRPVGLVSITVFPASKCPFGNDRNVAMVYVVGPNCGKARKRTKRAVDDMTCDEFLEVIEATGNAVGAAASQYNAAAAKDKALPRIDVLRVCLVSGGVYKHPAASKQDVAARLISGLVRDGERELPCLDFAWDDDAFQTAWRHLGFDAL
mmetsp:Transcript_97403/g.275422  ORF Transcript_97403/g.275422 Transcript_97403/m.275422 type:complete len:557 (+) Transcript_97403:91-1761(+)